MFNETALGDKKVSYLRPSPTEVIFGALKLFPCPTVVLFLKLGPQEPGGCNAAMFKRQL
jgi:hypothetical protein